MRVHLAATGLCQCACEDCTLRLTGYCVCLDCGCGTTAQQPDFKHKIGKELRTDVTDGDHYGPAGIGLPGGVDPQRPVPVETTSGEADPGPVAQQETVARRTAVPDRQG